jgi:dynactin complex subunit
VVATTTTAADGLPQPVKFRAVVKYLGETFFGPGQWVGVEVAEKEEMVHKDWNDGTVDGVRYFELGQESKESKLRLFRNLSATPSGSAPPNGRSHSSTSSYLNSNGLNEDVGSVNSLRPSFVSKSSSNRSHFSASYEDERPTRGLFVRPQEVIFVF